MLRAALSAGLSGAAITDHCEADDPELTEDGPVPGDSFAAACKMKETYAGRLKVLAGIELGQPLFNRAAAERLLNNFPFDFVLCSLHNLKEAKDFYFLTYDSAENAEKLLTAYFDEVLKIVRWNRFDSLAHLTYPLRYIEGEAGIKVNISRFDDVIREILKTLAQNGKALEINTSGLRQKIGRTLPDLPDLKRFKELGGEYITIGSDAHKPEDVGAGLKRGIELIKQAGFSCYQYYENRIPHTIPIE